MTPAARLQAALDILDAIEKDQRPADVAVGAYFRGRRYIGAKDRSAAAELAYGILRHQARLGWWCAHYRIPPTPRARLIVYLRLALGEKAQAAAQYFSGAKFAPAPLDAEESRFLERLAGHDLLHPNMPVAVKFEMPAWIMPQCAVQFGARLERELAALLESAPLDLRVNAVKAAREDVMQELQAAGLTPAPCRYAPFGIRLGARAGLPSLPAFKEGRIEVQEEASQLAAMLVDARPGMRVADFCAGAGGKSLALGAAMANKGRITALDVVEKRLQRGTERFRRAGLHNIETRVLESENDPWIKRHKHGFDRVLADAPCSGSGAWRRNPDARWKLSAEGLASLLALQQRILISAARLVKPGGRLIYATCSLLDAENREQVAAFLAAQPEFSLLPYGEIWRDLNGAPLPSLGDMLQLTPAQHGTDGFFVAVMARKEG